MEEYFGIRLWIEVVDFEKPKKIIKFPKLVKSIKYQYSKFWNLKMKLDLKFLNLQITKIIFKLCGFIY